MFLTAERRVFLLKTSMKYYTCQLARQRATVIIVADVNDDPIEYTIGKSLRLMHGLFPISIFGTTI